jgi:3',5'-cyclic AMP phosphodiesterase CpdA
MDIIHISDPHFSTSNKYLSTHLIEYRNALCKLLKGYENPYLLVTGDITLKGRVDGYDMAKDFFSFFIDNGHLDRNRFLCCPGNHDIQGFNNPFDAFDKFCYAIRRDNALDFSKNDYVCLDLENSNYSILLLNSAHHKDHTYGKFGKSTLDFFESLSENDRNWIVATHHNLIPIFENDNSTTRNSFELLYWAERSNMKLILHGHQHCDLQLAIGKNRVKLKSCRSFSFESFPIQNGGNIISINDDIVVKSFTVSHDSIPNKITLNIVGTI